MELPAWLKETFKNDHCHNEEIMVYRTSSGKARENKGFATTVLAANRIKMQN